MSARAASPSAAASSSGAVSVDRPAFYALRGGGARDWGTLLHPPYTAWHLSYVAVGAALSPAFGWERLALALAAFFLAVGVAAHALDELHGRPLRTEIAGTALAAVAVLSLVCAVGLGVYASFAYTPWLALFVVVGGFLVVAYNLELAGGRFHTDAWFALAWGAFPLLTGAFVMDERVTLAAAIAAVFAYATSLAQRRLSTRVRDLRRRVASVQGRLDRTDGSSQELSRDWLLEPAEGALRALAGGMVALAAALVIMRGR
jgi:hypothetical protein